MRRPQRDGNDEGTAARVVGWAGRIFGLVVGLVVGLIGSIVAVLLGGAFGDAFLPVVLGGTLGGAAFGFLVPGPFLFLAEVLLGIFSDVS